MRRLDWITPIFLLLTLPLAGCSSNSDIEGDAPGECRDGADNDRDGAFDCDDSDCAGAPVCKGEVEQDGGVDGGVDAGLSAWTQTTAGGVHNCAIRIDGTLACWGNDAQGQSAAPSGNFSDVRASFFHSCGRRTDGSFECWGCKGDKDYGQCDVPVSLTEVSRFDVGTYATCITSSSGAALCWGCNGTDHGQCDPPVAVYTAIAAGSLHTCGLVDGTVSCWGNDEYGQSTPPGGIFTQLSAGTWHTCGVRDDKTVLCWGCNAPSPGSPADFGQCDAPAGAFEQVTVGVYHSCGLKSDGRVSCWGCTGDHNGEATDTGQCSPPDESFGSIGVGKFHGCGLRSDGTIGCWGNDFYGQLQVP